MRSIILKVVIAAFFLAISTVSFGQKTYIKKYKPTAQSLSKKYGIPSSVILGVAIVESSSGQNRNSKLLNNHFGIKGKNNLRKKGIYTKYKQYPAAKASYADFCKLLSRKPYYKKLKGSKNYTKWVEAISRHGYAANPSSWKKKVITTIKKNKLA